jgi:hypothetical protein
MTDERLILIGSSGRNAGKTTLATELIRLWRDVVPITALKVTTVHEGGCPHGDAGCGACALSGGFALERETGRDPAKDTARLLAAGAERVFWLRATPACLAEGYARFLQETPPQSLIICESNSLREVLTPALFIMVTSAAPVKASAARVASLAQITVALPLDSARIAAQVSLGLDAQGFLAVRLVAPPSTSRSQRGRSGC